MKMTKSLGHKIRDLFFYEDVTTAGVGDASDGARVYRCRCGETQTLMPGECSFAGFTEHVISEHEEWLAAAVQGPGDASTINGSADEQSSEENGAPASVEVPRETATRKRSDYLPWDDYFMSVAFLSAMRSKDPSTQVGACIVNPDRKIVGIGYNGFPNGCGDDELPWGRSSTSGSPLETKYPFVCHAEMNAILNKNSTDVKGCTIYVALFPCNECAKLIIQSGIARVVYCSDKYRDDWKFVASRRLLDMAGVQCMQHALRQSQVVIDFSSVE